MFRPGDDVIHLASGLAQVVAEQQEGAFLLVRPARGDDLWVPRVAAAEHLRALPTADQARAWRDAPLTPAADTPSARERRARTLRHRDFDRQAAALRDGYACGDPGDALEARVLPVFARALGCTPDELRRAMRAKPTAILPPADAPIDVPAPLFEPLGRATFGDRVLVGDPGDDAVAIVATPGTWIGFQWSIDGDVAGAQVVAVHEHHARDVLALLATSLPRPDANAEAASANVYDATAVADPAVLDELGDPVEPGRIADRGFSVALGGDGAYAVRAAYHGDRAVCIVAGHALHPFERDLLLGREPAFDALDDLEELDDAAADRVRDLVDAVGDGRVPASPSLIAQLERLHAAASLAACTASALARVADADRWLPPLVDHFERTGRAPWYVVKALRARPALGRPLIARLDREPWCAARFDVLDAIADLPEARAALDALWRDDAGSPWTRARAAATLLRHVPACDVARGLTAWMAEYPEHDTTRDGPHAGYGTDFDEVLGPLAEHARACVACRVPLVTTLFRIRRSGDDGYRRLAILSPEVLAELTGARDDGALWAWLDRHRG